LRLSDATRAARSWTNKIPVRTLPNACVLKGVRPQPRSPCCSERSPVSSCWALSRRFPTRPHKPPRPVCPAPKEDPVQLSVFEVSTSQDTGYANTDARNERTGVAKDLQPKHRFTAFNRYNFTTGALKGFSASLGTIYTGERPLTRSTIRNSPDWGPLPPWWRVDAIIG
jgi:hypothetical protein